MRKNYKFKNYSNANLLVDKGRKKKICSQHLYTVENGFEVPRFNDLDSIKAKTYDNPYFSFHLVN